MTRTAPAETLLALADQCVMCGLCLPHCPTYALAQDEAESPRGRIAIMRAVASGRAVVGDAVFQHLDQCLACRACETACPSQVAYEKILVGARELIEPLRMRRSIIHRLAARPQWLSRLARLARFSRAHAWLPPLLGWLPTQSTVRRLVEALPAPPPRQRAFGAAVAPTRERIALFEGCVASNFDRDTLDATRHLLRRLGHDVVSPAANLCCGALPRHAGKAAATVTVAAATRQALLGLQPTRVAISATGCHGALTDTLATTGMAVVDAIHLIAGDAELDRLRFRPLSRRAALHLPCSQVNGSGSADALRRLLARISGLTVIELPAQPRCCGAAGSYFIEQPAIADRLREQRLDQLSTQSADLLLTSSIGCRIHLGNGLRQRGETMPVLHPLTLLAQQLEEA